MTFHDQWITFPAGIAIATVSSLTGIGGGILWAPFFLLALKANPHEAIVLSLLIQIFGQGSGAYANHRLKKVDWHLVRLFCFYAIPGVFLGSFMSNMIPGKNLALFLGIMCMVAAFAFLLVPEEYGDEGRTRISKDEARKFWWAPFFSSFLAGLLSIGIGNWLVPILNTKVRLKMSSSIANVLGIMFIVGIVGSLVHLVLGHYPDWHILLWGVPGVFIGGQIGPRLVSRINENHIKEAFIFLLTLTGCHIIFNVY